MRQFVLTCVWTPVSVGRSLPMLPCRSLYNIWSQASQAMVPDHVVEAPAAETDLMSVGSYLIRSKHESTWHKALTLLKCKGHGAGR
jgi:hypothetical protein